jgi:hypothetical protein
MNLSEIGPMRGIAAFGFALVVVGPFLSWIRIGSTSTPGVETDAGLTALVLGPVGIGLALFGRRLPAKLLAVAVAVVVFALAMGDVNWVADSRETTGFDYHLGGGLMLLDCGAAHGLRELSPKVSGTPPLNASSARLSSGRFDETGMVTLPRSAAE